MRVINAHRRIAWVLAAVFTLLLCLPIGPVWCLKEQGTVPGKYYEGDIVGGRDSWKIAAAIIMFGAILYVLSERARDKKRAPAQEPEIKQSPKAPEAAKSAPADEHPGAAEQPADDFAAAARRGLVRVTISGSTQCGPNSLLALVDNTGAETIRLRVAAGTVLLPDSNRYQRSVVCGVTGITTGGGSSVAADEIVVRGHRSEAFALHVYRLGFDKGSPPMAVSFRAEGVDDEARSVLEAAAERGLSAAGTQAALWMHLEGVNQDQIRARITISDAELKSAAELIPVPEPAPAAEEHS